jgi:hypothetical protein
MDPLPEPGVFGRSAAEGHEYCLLALTDINRRTPITPVLYPLD